MFAKNVFGSHLKSIICKTINACVRKASCGLFAPVCGRPPQAATRGWPALRVTPACTCGRILSLISYYTHVISIIS